MTVKGTLIATLAAGYIASVAPIAAFAGDEAPAAKGEKASCKGPNGCKGEKAEKGKKKDKGEKAEKGEKKEEAPKK